MTETDSHKWKVLGYSINKKKETERRSTVTTHRTAQDKYEAHSSFVKWWDSSVGLQS